MGQKNENETNSKSEPIQNGFNVDLKNLVDEIESIRKIKMITDNEYDSIQQLNEMLNKKDIEIENLNNEIKGLKKDKREKDDLNNLITQLREDNERDKERLSLYVWGTIWSILVVFSFCAIWLFVGLPSIDDSLRHIPLLTGKLFILLIMAILLIVFSNNAKKLITNQNER